MKAKVVKPLSDVVVVAVILYLVQVTTSQQDASPPPDDSYFVPYGDRILMALQFPTFPDKQKSASQLYGPPTSAPYGRVKRGLLHSVPLTVEWFQPLPPPPPKIIWVEKPTAKQPLDFGVISSQNFIYRKNIRDSEGFNRILREARPSDEVLLDWAKQLVSGGDGFSNSSKRSAKGEPLSFLPRDLQGYFQQKMGMKRKGSFVIVALESRQKYEGGGPSTAPFTNGSVIFPSSKDPRVLSTLPFQWEMGADISKVFEGEGNSVNEPESLKEMLDFLKLAQMIHSDTFSDGDKRRAKLHELNSRQKRERLPDTADLAPDDKAQEEELARRNHWLVTSTVAIRALTPPPMKQYQKLIIPQVWTVPLTHPPLLEIIKPVYSEYAKK